MFNLPVKALLPVLLLCIPYFYFSKWLERKIQPRQSGRRFLSWLLLVIVSAISYFWLCGSLYLYFFSPKLFRN